MTVLHAGRLCLRGTVTPPNGRLREERPDPHDSHSDSECDRDGDKEHMDREEAGGFSLGVAGPGILHDALEELRPNYQGPHAGNDQDDRQDGRKLHASGFRARPGPAAPGC